jgi:hypothetical protein
MQGIKVYLKVGLRALGRQASTRTPTDRKGENTYRVVVSDMIARERAALGLPVVNEVRAWNGPQETLIAAAGEAEAWDYARALFPPTDGYRVETVRLAAPDG